MFTGIVEERGEVVGVETLTDSICLTVRGPLVTSDVGVGDSIAVNGVCLTVTSTTKGVFTADVMNETLACSSLGSLAPGSSVNLERPVTLQSRLGGHLVQGHVDGTGEVLRRTHSEHWEILEISLPADLARYFVHKGSVTVDGVSLTIAGLSERSFTVSLVPATLELTNLGDKSVNDVVNLEVDVIAKYVEKLVATSVASPGATSAGAVE